ncbi:MAG TPA: hypothetical protein VF828_02945 [Patescibacteria group bacterium]
MVWPKNAQAFFKKLKLIHILVGAFLLRLVLLPLTFHGDVTVTYWWGKFASEFGWRGYYDWLNFGGYGRPDQPMLNIYYVWAIRQIYLFAYNILWFINIKIPMFPSAIMSWYFLYGNQILLKFPMILSDIAFIYAVFRFIKSEFNEFKAKIAALILALYIPLIYNSALWGSGDSIINLFGLLAVYSLYRKKYFVVPFFFLLSVLYKASLLIWSPLLLIMLLKQNTRIADYLKMAVFSLIFLYVICAPFSPVEINPIIWFFSTMSTKILPGAMPQLTANSFNFWALLFGLKPRLDELLILPHLSARLLSLIICLVFYTAILINMWKHYSIKTVLLSLVNISMTTFMFMTRMHERYTFPVLIPLLLLCFYDKKFIKYFLILTATHLLNVYNWWWFPLIPFLVSFLSIPAVIWTLSLVNLILSIKLLGIQLLSNVHSNKLFSFGFNFKKFNPSWLKSNS